MTIIRYSPDSIYWNETGYDPSPDQYDFNRFEIIDNQLTMIHVYISGQYPDYIDCQDYYPVIHGPLTKDVWTDPHFYKDEFESYGFNPYSEQDFTCKS